MSSYRNIMSLTAPRRKRATREKVIPFDDHSKGERIYSTLSKKPADLDTTDVDLSAIRVFLSDGSHRTVSSTPNTTCGEILNSLLGKLGLSQQRDEYGLQVKYKYSESRIAGELEKISDLNQHVWDSVDRIFLCKKETDLSLPHHLQRKKRLASFEGTLSSNDIDNIYANAAVLRMHFDAGTGDSMEPVLLNEKIASGFARAWRVGSQRHKAGEHGGQKPLGVNPTFEPVCQNSEADGRRNTYSSYTLDRKTTRRRTPVSSPRTTPCSTPKHFSVQTSPTFPMRGPSTSPTQTPPSGGRKFGNSLSPQSENGRKIVRSQSPSHFANKRNFSQFSNKEVENQPSTLVREKSQSVGSLLAVIESEQNKNLSRTSSQLTRDSGFDDSNSRCSLNSSKHSSSIRDSREKSGSLDNLTSSCFLDVPWQAHISPAMSVPSLAKHTHKAPTTKSISQGDTPQHATNLNAATLKSAQSIELLTEEDLDTITNATLAEMNTTPPSIPKRSSAFLENCTIPDDYLLSQGRRIGELMQLTPKKEEKNHFKSLQRAFTRVGTLLKRGKSSPTHTPTKRVEPSPPSTTGKINSKGVRMSQVEYDEVEIRENDTPKILKKGTLSPHMQKRAIQKKLFVKGLSTCNLLTEPQCTLPIQASTLKPCSSLVDLRNAGKYQDSLTVPHPHKRQMMEKYDIAVPAKIPPRLPHYLTIIGDSNQEERKYDNRTIEQKSIGNHFYQTPSPTSGSQKKDTEPDRGTYLNHHIQAGPKNGITFNGSPLHTYVVPHPAAFCAATPKPEDSVTAVSTSLYINQEIHQSMEGGIAFSGGDLHVYQVPGSQHHALSPPPPPLPPKPSNDQPYPDTETNVTAPALSTRPPSMQPLSISTKEEVENSIDTSTHNNSPMLQQSPSSLTIPQIVHITVNPPTTTEASPAKQSPLVPPPNRPNQATKTFPLSIVLPTESQKTPVPPKPSKSNSVPLLTVIPSQTLAESQKIAGPPVPPKPLSQSVTIDNLKDILRDRKEGYSRLQRPSSESDLYSEPMTHSLLHSHANEVPGYSKLFFGNSTNSNTMISAAIKPPHKPLPCLPPTGPPFHTNSHTHKSRPPPKHSHSTPFLLDLEGIPPKVLKSQRSEPSIRNTPLPPEPVFESSDPIYDTIPSPPHTAPPDSLLPQTDTDGYMDMSPSGVPQNISHNAEDTTQASSLVIKLSSVLGGGKATSKPHKVLPTPPPPPPKKKVLLADSTPSSSGKIYRSWSTPLDDPRKELQDKLKRRFETLLGESGPEESSIPNGQKSSRKAPILPPTSLKPNDLTTRNINNDINESSKGKKNPPLPPEKQKTFPGEKTKPLPPTPDKAKLPPQPPTKQKCFTPPPPPSTPPPPSVPGGPLLPRTHKPMPTISPKSAPTSCDTALVSGAKPLPPVPDKAKLPPQPPTKQKCFTPPPPPSTPPPPSVPRGPLLPPTHKPMPTISPRSAPTSSDTALVSGAKPLPLAPDKAKLPSQPPTKQKCFTPPPPPSIPPPPAIPRGPLLPPTHKPMPTISPKSDPTSSDTALVSGAKPLPPAPDKAKLPPQPPTKQKCFTPPPPPSIPPPPAIPRGPLLPPTHKPMPTISPRSDPTSSDTALVSGAKPLPPAPDKAKLSPQPPTKQKCFTPPPPPSIPLPPSIPGGPLLPRTHKPKPPKTSISKNISDSSTSGELFNQELFQKFRSISHRLDTTTCRSDEVYGNMV